VTWLIRMCDTAHPLTSRTHTLTVDTLGNVRGECACRVKCVVCVCACVCVIHLPPSHIDDGRRTRQRSCRVCVEGRVCCVCVHVCVRVCFMHLPFSNIDGRYSYEPMCLRMHVRETERENVYVYVCARENEIESKS